MHLDSQSLRNAISREEFDYTLLCSVLSPYAGTRQKINSLLKAGAIIRVKKGLYVFGDKHRKNPICKEVLANLIYGPSYISLQYALAFYGLIPERVETLTSVTPKKDKVFATPVGDFTYRYLKPEKYRLAIHQVWLDATHPVLIASPDKALCDYIVLSKVPDLANKEAAKEFLQYDIRIDSSHWHRFDKNALWDISRIYKNRNLNYMVDILGDK